MFWGTRRERPRRVPWYGYPYPKYLYHTTQKKNHGYSTSISMPTTRALIRAGIDSDVDQYRGHVCSKATTTRGVV